MAGPTVKCLEALNAPQNGRKSLNPKGYYEAGDSVRFYCRGRYSLVGSSRIICQQNGTWSSTAPVCRYTGKL